MRHSAQPHSIPLRPQTIERDLLAIATKCFMQTPHFFYQQLWFCCCYKRSCNLLDFHSVFCRILKIETEREIERDSEWIHSSSLPLSNKNSVFCWTFRRKKRILGFAWNGRVLYLCVFCAGRRICANIFMADIDHFYITITQWQTTTNAITQQWTVTPWD